MVTPCPALGLIIPYISQRELNCSTWMLRGSFRPCSVCCWIDSPRSPDHIYILDIGKKPLFLMPWPKMWFLLFWLPWKWNFTWSTSLSTNYSITPQLLNWYLSCCNFAYSYSRFFTRFGVGLSAALKHQFKHWSAAIVKLRSGYTSLTFGGNRKSLSMPLWRIPGVDCGTDNTAEMSQLSGIRRTICITPVLLGAAFISSGLRTVWSDICVLLI